MDKRHCKGCIDDFYNGNNDFGIKECVHLKTAEIVPKKKIPLSQRPPWLQKPINVPSCFKQRGYVFWNPDRTC